MSREIEVHSGGVGVLGMLGVLFVALKLTDVIAWSWWWVLAPFWGPMAAAMIAGIVLLFIYLLEKK